MINPAEINFSALPWVPLDATAGFPSQPGIYFAIDSTGTIQYIGRSGDVRGRWKRHHRYEDLAAIGGVKIAYLFVDTPELLPAIEEALIAWFRPLLNVVKSESLASANPTRKKKAINTVELTKDHDCGHHPNSLKNLALSPRAGRTKTYDEDKKKREVSITETGWEGAKAIAEQLNCRGVSELLEQLGRDRIAAVRLPEEAIAALQQLPDDRAYITAAVLAKLEADGLLERGDRLAEQKPDIRQEYYDDFMQRR